MYILFDVNFSWENFGIFNSENHWSEFRIPEEKSIAIFYSGNGIIVISSEGRYYVAEFSKEESGNCIKTDEFSLNINAKLDF